MYMKSGVYHLQPFPKSMSSGVYQLLSLCHVHEVWFVPSATILPWSYNKALSVVLLFTLCFESFLKTNLKLHMTMCVEYPYL